MPRRRCQARCLHCRRWLALVAETRAHRVTQPSAMDPAWLLQRINLAGGRPGGHHRQPDRPGIFGRIGPNLRIRRARPGQLAVRRFSPELRRSAGRCSPRSGTRAQRFVLHAAAHRQVVVDRTQRRRQAGRVLAVPNGLAISDSSAAEYGSIYVSHSAGRTAYLRIGSVVEPRHLRRRSTA